MDFIEDNIVNNTFIPTELKLYLLNSDQMIPYSFVGAFLAICNFEGKQVEDLIDIPKE